MTTRTKSPTRRRRKDKSTGRGRSAISAKSKKLPSSAKAPEVESADVPTRDIVRNRVFGIVAGTANKDINEIREYLYLKKDLGFDQVTIEGMTPGIHAIVKPYGKEVTISEVGKQETVGQLVDLPWNKIKPS